MLLLLSGFSIASVPLKIRYKNKIFSSVDINKDVIYGSAYDYNHTLINLKMDVYQPHGDKDSKRALIIMIHGGGFYGGDKSNGHISCLCEDFAKRGYVTASINYRLQPKDNIDYSTAITQAMHDAKAAVRYFRAYSNIWRIDDKKIALLGSSAGAITSLHQMFLPVLIYREVFTTMLAKSMPGSLLF